MTMKQYFEYMDKFMLRIPYQAEAEKKEWNYNEQEIIEICKNPVFREQVLVASKNLYDVMIQFEATHSTMAKKKKNDFIKSIIEYHIRSLTRTTPFGLFSSVSLGTFGTENKIEVDKRSFYKCSKVDCCWLTKLIKRIEEECPEHLKYKINDAVNIKGNRISLLYSVDDELDEVSIRKTNAYDIVAQYGYQLVELHILVEELKKNYPDMEEEKLKDYLKQLIQKGVFISELRPPFTENNQLEYVIEKLNQFADYQDLVKQLEQLKEMLLTYDKMELGQGEDQYLKILEYMENIQKAKDYLQVDSAIKDPTVQLSYRYGQDISGLLSLLTYMSNPVKRNNSQLDIYRNKFLERYGYEREVPLLEMLDRSKGIGAPTYYTKPSNDYEEVTPDTTVYNLKLKDYFMLKYVKALQEHSVIELKEEELKQLCGEEVPANEMPVSVDLYFAPKREGNSLRFYFSPTFGADVAGKTYGRFAYMSEAIEQQIKDISEKQKEIVGDKITICDINYMPSNSRNGNVASNKSFRDKEVALYCNSSKKDEDVIHMEDIIIGVTGEKFYAKDKKSGRQLLFQTGNMFNSMLTCNAVQFLQDIALDGTRKWSQFPWVYIFNNFKYVPRIQYKNFVLFEEKWNLKLQDLELSNNMKQEAFTERFTKVCDELGVPAEIYIIENDNKLRINRNTDYGIGILFREMKKKNKVTIEAVEKGEDFIRDTEGTVCPAEIVVSLYSKESIPAGLEVKKLPAVSLQERRQMPFKNWLYLKLYADRERETELISLHMTDYMKALKQNYEFDYFFIRYLDPKPHVRLRLKAKSSVLFQVYANLSNWLDGLLQDNVISDISIVPYDQEIERYGGPDIIELAEQVFFDDSMVVGELLKLKRMGKIKLKLSEIAIISIFFCLDQMGMMLAEQEYFLKNSYHITEYLPEFKKEKTRLLELCDLENDWSNFASTEEGKLIIPILSQRNESLKNYGDQIRKFDDVTRYSIVSSIVHMHCNRLMGVDRNAEAKVTCMCERVFNAKKYFLLGKGKDEQ